MTKELQAFLDMVRQGKLAFIPLGPKLFSDRNEGEVVLEGWIEFAGRVGKIDWDCNYLRTRDRIGFTNSVFNDIETGQYVRVVKRGDRLAVVPF